MLSKTVARPGKGRSPTARAAAGKVRAPGSSEQATIPAKGKKRAVRIFVSYSHGNAVQQAKLQIHLAQLKRDEVEPWYDEHMAAGDTLSAEISRKLREADLFVALMSPEYLASHWCQLEYNRAMGRRARG